MLLRGRMMTMSSRCLYLSKGKGFKKIFSSRSMIASRHPSLKIRIWTSMLSTLNMKREKATKASKTRILMRTLKVTLRNLGQMKTKNLMILRSSNLCANTRKLRKKESWNNRRRTSRSKKNWSAASKKK